MRNFLNYSDKEIEDLVNDVYNGVTSREVLPVGLYRDIQRRLNKAVLDGFGGGAFSDFSEDTAEGLIMSGFEKNIAVFSGAKTFQQVNDMSNFLFAGKDKIPFGEFKKHADEIFDTYNGNWLKTEYNTAISQASSARQWHDIKTQADVFPLIKFITVGDERVRSSHKPFDEIVLPVSDPFWNKYLPPLDFNCRCTTEQLEDGEEPVTDMKGREMPEIHDLFKMNAGEDKIIFDESVHSYFKVDQRYKVALGQNFGLPFVPQVKKIRAPRVPKVKPVPVVPEVVPEFKKIKNVKEFKARIVSSFKSLAGFEVNSSIRVSTVLKVDDLNANLEALEGLLENYEVSDTILKEYVAKVNFASTKSSYGFISSATHRNVTTGGYRGTQIVEMNFGSLSDTGSGRIFDPLATLTRGKSRVDAENLKIATVVHEFAHVIVTDRAALIQGSKGGEFIKKALILRNEYNSDLNIVHQLTDKRELLQLSLGKYASTNLNEFIAEAFTEYKLSSNPSKYASKLGELMDEYFKKPTKK